MGLLCAEGFELGIEKCWYACSGWSQGNQGRFVGYLEAEVGCKVRLLAGMYVCARTGMSLEK